MICIQLYSGNVFNCWHPHFATKICSDSVFMPRSRPSLCKQGYAIWNTFCFVLRNQYTAVNVQTIRYSNFQTCSRNLDLLGAFGPRPGATRYQIIIGSMQSDREMALRNINGVCPSPDSNRSRPREHIAFSSPLCVALVVAWPYRQHVRPLYRFVFVCGKNTHTAVHSVCADQIFARMDVEDIWVLCNMRCL